MAKLLYIDQYPVESILSKVVGEGFKLDVGRNYLEANSYVEDRDNKPNFIICSLDGYHEQCFNFLRKLKSSSLCLPVICIAHNFTNNDIITGYSLGVADFMTKPIDPNILLAKMHSQMMLIGKNFEQPKQKQNAEDFSLTSVQRQITEAIEIISKNDPNTSNELKTIRKRLSKLATVADMPAMVDSETVNLRDTITVVANYIGLSCVDTDKGSISPVLIMDYKYFCAAIEHMFEYIKAITSDKGVLRVSHIISNGNFEMVIELHDSGTIIAPQRLEFTRKIINLHGGGMELEERYGKGTKIIITLPSYRVL